MLNDQDFDAYLSRVSGAARAAQDGQPATLEGIAAEPWDAVNRAIPQDASPEFRDAMKAAAGACVEEAHSAMNGVYGEGAKFATHAADLTAEGAAPDAHEYFEQHHLNALKRFEELSGIDRGPPDGGSPDNQPEALTSAAIERYQLSAVNLPIPSDADRALLERVASAADDLSNRAWHQVIEHKAPDGREWVGGPAVEDSLALAEGADARAATAHERLLEHDVAREEALFRDTPAVEPQAEFADAARAALRTPHDMGRRELAQVVNLLAEQTGVKDTPAHTAFQQEQATIGDKITREPDLEKRAELRREQEAAVHIYAADLFDNLGSRALSLGDLDGAKDMHELAETHREVAGLRPDGPTRPDGEKERPVERTQTAFEALAEVDRETEPDRRHDSREQFAADARDVGREVLSHSAAVVMVADGPEPQEQPDGAAARRRAQNRAEIMPIEVFDLGRTLATGQHTAAPDRHQTAWQALAAVDREVETDRSGAPVRDLAADGVDDRMALARANTDAEAKQADHAAIHGAGAGEARPDSRQTAWEALAEVDREVEAEGHAGPERESGQGAAKSGGRYAALTL